MNDPQLTIGSITFGPGPIPPGDNGSAHSARPLSEKTKENIKLAAIIALKHCEDSVDYEEETLP